MDGNQDRDLDGTLTPLFPQLALPVRDTILRSHPPGTAFGSWPHCRIVRLPSGPRAVPVPASTEAAADTMAVHLVDVAVREGDRETAFGIAMLGWHRSPKEVLDAATDHLLHLGRIGNCAELERQIIGRIDLCDCCYGTGRHPVVRPGHRPEPCLLCSGTGHRIVPDDVWRSFLRSMRHRHQAAVGRDVPADTAGF